MAGGQPCPVFAGEPHAFHRHTDRGRRPARPHHRAYADLDGCSKRSEVVLEEAVTELEHGAGCQLTGGSSYSPYDDTYFTVARALIAVSAASNRSKTDQHPATWQLRTIGYRRTYGTDWVAVKKPHPYRGRRTLPG
ncbi:putative secreted protein [Streptomyces viridochromogenes Tue57]|uniref:Putative secreted protein n=1 Tax=Streptomyces viridochromogenes Tue57 TaxID=1160705 RepID=L8P2F4_STRVR|nr:putative secreted protein [Streptomyces viridochromogenes Tue57]